jgi:hypothetical protein
MFRWGYRRGKGKFLSVYGGEEGTDSERRRAATIERVSGILSKGKEFEGFDSDVGHAILGDLLLSFCLENAKHALGRTEQVQRVAPAHYMSSWVDLPDKVAHLRFIPEMIVSLLSDQSEGSSVRRTSDKTWFAVGKDYKDNALLKVFHSGMTIRGETSSRTSDSFVEDSSVGIDQLLMIRLGQHLGEAPDKQRGSEGEQIPNQRPIAERISRHFSEDIRRFVRGYAEAIPRQTLVPMLESCMAVGLSTILTACVEIVLEWATTGDVPKKCNQKPKFLLFDCSSGLDRSLRALSEQSFDDLMRQVDRFPVVLMCMRLVDYAARNDPKIKRLAVSTIPFATDWLNLLGSILHDRHEQSTAILYNFEQKTSALAEKLREDSPELAAMLENVERQPNPVHRIAETLSIQMGRNNLWANVNKCLDSCLHLDRPNGLAVKRRVRQLDSFTGRKTREIRSLVLTDTALDYLVHLHLLPSGNGSGFRALSYKEFLRIVRERYGICVDEAPPGMTVSNELLQANRRILERRLRDLGLLEGVNDAEAMKRLTPRFELHGEGEHDPD